MYTLQMAGESKLETIEWFAKLDSCDYELWQETQTGGEKCNTTTSAATAPSAISIRTTSIMSLIIFVFKLIATG